MAAQGPTFEDRLHRSAQLRVSYSGTHLGGLADVLRPFVLLEIGDARATPYVQRHMTSFIHDELDALGQLHLFDENRPKAVRCVHPLVTLIEKLDAPHRRVPRADLAPATFVRHFEDAARIIASEGALPGLDGYESPRALADEMLAQRQVAVRPVASDIAFEPDTGSRFADIRRAHLAIAPMFWGPRIGIGEACAAIRGWIRQRLQGLGLGSGPSECRGCRGPGPLRTNPRTRSH